MQLFELLDLSGKLQVFMPLFRLKYIWLYLFLLLASLF